MERTPGKKEFSVQGFLDGRSWKAVTKYGLMGAAGAAVGLGLFEASGLSADTFSIDNILEAPIK